MFTQISQTAKEEMVFQTAKKLLEPQNRITTLEIKKQLIKDFSAIKWEQQFVHDTMQFLYEQGVFIIVDDNGTYRTYADPNYNPLTVDAVIVVDQLSDGSFTKTIALDSSNIPVSYDGSNAITTLDSSDTQLTKTVIDTNTAKNLMEKNRGHYFTAFVNENGQKVVLNCQYVKGLQDQNSPNFVNLKLRKQTPNSLIRVDLNSLVELSINKKIFEVVNA